MLFSGQCFFKSICFLTSIFTVVLEMFYQCNYIAMLYFVRQVGICREFSTCEKNVFQVVGTVWKYDFDGKLGWVTMPLVSLCIKCSLFFYRSARDYCQIRIQWQLEVYMCARSASAQERRMDIPKVITSGKIFKD